VIGIQTDHLIEIHYSGFSILIQKIVETIEDLFGFCSSIENDVVEVMIRSRTTAELPRLFSVPLTLTVSISRGSPRITIVFDSSAVSVRRVEERTARGSRRIPVEHALRAIHDRVIGEILRGGNEHIEQHVVDYGLEVRSEERLGESLPESLFTSRGLIGDDSFDPGLRGVLVAIVLVDAVAGVIFHIRLARI
jgi:hypothetical protein